MKKNLILVAAAATMLSTQVSAAETLFEYYRSTAQAGVGGETQREYESKTLHGAEPVRQNYDLSVNGSSASASLDYNLEVSHFDNGATLSYYIDADIDRSEGDRGGVTISHGGNFQHSIRATEDGVLRVNFNVEQIERNCPEIAPCLPLNSYVSAGGNGYRGSIAYDPKNGFKDGVDYIEIPAEKGRTYKVEFSSSGSISGGPQSQSVSASYSVTWEMAPL
ncbi:hypothetical protein O5O45_17930 [Hahella aquimaris]|uniref:hypothetical protein n=1 Tax=Hahella sp. HNIBRBA332 TaxID=3015983 RepID=UPI00273AC8F8|nr:hypothetical protein [Hahella sp. HNIBRBA332]WLQ11614.1 hypothetical protein O5O45_17930 [Hahella sp. HNIBRBA332]